MGKSGKIVGIIEARFGASRLPGKVLKPIMGKPMLELMIERVRRAKTLDDVIIATADTPQDDGIEDLAGRLGVTCFRGSEEDVMARVLGAAQSLQTDHIVELWGDTPLIDPGIIDAAVEHYLSTEFDLVGTCLDKTFVWGMSLLVFPTAILAEIEARTQDPVDRENVSNHIYEHPQRYRIGHLPCPLELRRPEIRLTVDEAADFQMVKTIFEELYPSDPCFTAEEIVSFLDSNPNLKKTNEHVKQKVTRPQEPRA